MQTKTSIPAKTITPGCKGVICINQYAWFDFDTILTRLLIYEFQVCDSLHVYFKPRQLLMFPWIGLKFDLIYIFLNWGNSTYVCVFMSLLTQPTTVISTDKKKFYL